MTGANLLLLVCLPLFAAAAAASGSLVIRALLVGCGYVRLVAEVRPWSCNLCMSFWSCLLVSAAFSWFIGAAALIALAGVAPSAVLLRLAAVSGGSPTPLPLPVQEGLEQVKQVGQQ